MLKRSLQAWLLIGSLGLVSVAARPPPCSEILRLKQIGSKSYGRLTVEVEPGTRALNVDVKIAENSLAIKRNARLSTSESSEQIVEAMNHGGNITFLANFIRDTESAQVLNTNYNGNSLCGSIPDVFPSLTFSLIYDAKLVNNSLLVDQEIKRRVKRQANCGTVQKNVQALIAGGEESNIQDWPWMASLLSVADGTPKFFCGGSLVEVDMVLTAAHCLTTGRKKNNEFILHFTSRKFLRVNLGSTDSIDIDGDYIKKYHKVKQIYIHPRFSRSLANDIAILHINTVNFNEVIQPVCLSKTNMNTKGYVVGWGAEKNDKKSHTNILKQAKVSIISPSQCRADGTLADYVTSNTFCIVGDNGSPCQGDSGSGLFVKQKTLIIQRGVVSLKSSKVKCEQINKKVVFTDVSKYISWIESVEKNILN